MRKKCQRRDGRYIPRYDQNIPIRIRVKYDYLEERVLFNDWMEYRDGLRECLYHQKYGNKPKGFKKNLRKYPNWQNILKNPTIVKSLKKWDKKLIWKKKRKLKHSEDKLFSIYQYHNKVYK